ncbi:MAG TPA: DUF1801 domain-containing protein [Chthoniobacterales bacterium]|nr:DUF1801 domain-containing protein [Chthoniobacterales bacterium]
MSGKSEATERASAALEQFLSPYDPAIRSRALRLRALVLAEAPTATELLYDSYNAVAIAFTFTGRLAEAFCHVAVYPRHINLGFNRGSELADPDGVLLGRGKLIRHLKVRAPEDLERPQLKGFLRMAIGRAVSSPTGEIQKATIVKAASPRTRRPA